MQHQGCNTYISMTHCTYQSNFFVSMVFSFIFSCFVFTYCGFIVCIKTLHDLNFFNSINMNVKS